MKKNVNSIHFLLNKNILQYYDDLASRYDESRFTNSYGQYIHAQEVHFVEKYLNKKTIQRNLDIACGTGRWLDFADYGIDISPKMITQAKAKFPSKNIQISSAEHLPFKDSFFKNALSFHLFMHLNEFQMQRILAEVHRVLELGAYFIFDIPSKKRRTLTKYKKSGWHGNHQASVASILDLLKNDWELVDYHGIAFFPIHHFPVAWRRFFLPVDNFLGQTRWKEYSSHLIFILKKR